ncbi:glutamine cyclotransferase [Flavobacterium cyanobacteriorum]|uniref:Glutamine cyclotransferase n=1 Tax=Flavobacterium cyanobacteriorum TaxID=2022802 RepID=A0A255ZB17_9FLAO|nr:glutaminyl-peptide cyclotransferase [Flavobacterium cyanobacteriorum]OYQ38084.1 glutamine cyclotransferase [Flavobacterium cyanobacteriorum]
MKKRNLLAFILLGAAMSYCGDDKTDKNNLFSIDTAALKEQYNPSEKVELSVINTQKKAIDSVVYFVNEAKAGTARGNAAFVLPLTGRKLGYQNIKAVVYYEGDTAETEGRIELVSDVTPKLLKYEIVNIYPHDIQAYTQGLEFYRDTLIEGTGQYGESNLRKTDYRTGKVYKQVNLWGKFFGEGITVLNNKIYQLTWRENTGYVYNADNLQQEREFTYFKNVEGWGLANDGTSLYQSDGTEKIWILDPQSLKEKDYLNVYTNSSKIKSVNELEWINGKLYGNIYQKDAIAVIDPETGAVEAVINLAELKKKVTQHAELDVLNGIAYNPKTKTIFVTGKNWDKMFEIKITE